MRTTAGLADVKETWGESHHPLEEMWRSGGEPHLDRRTGVTDVINCMTYPICHAHEMTKSPVCMHIRLVGTTRRLHGALVQPSAAAVPVARCMRTHDALRA